jgi:flagellar motility protein MotE (MotC chaperone)
MIFLGVLVVGARIGDAWHTLHNGILFAPVTRAQAQEAAAPAERESPQAAETPQTENEGAARAQTRQNEPSDTPESDLYRQLAGRRDQLDKREKELDSRDALIRVAEDRVEQKLKEMETLRGQLQALLGQAGAAQQAQLENLVKIYEIMKPKEAAQILETLDMPVLLGVIQKMKPARTAAVMAEMTPQKAKDITTALTRQNLLPQIN